MKGGAVMESHVKVSFILPYLLRKYPHGTIPEKIFVIGDYEN